MVQCARAASARSWSRSRFHRTWLSAPRPIESFRFGCSNWRGNAERRGRRQRFARPKVKFRCLNLHGSALPLFNRQFVADGDIVEPIRAILAEPDLAVLGFDGGVGV